MEKSTVEAPVSKAPAPTFEQVQDWVRKDVAACAVFLNMLVRHPDIVDELAKILYTKYTTDRQDDELLSKAERNG